MSAPTEMELIAWMVCHPIKTARFLFHPDNRDEWRVALQEIWAETRVTIHLGGILATVFVALLPYIVYHNNPDSLAISLNDPLILVMPLLVFVVSLILVPGEEPWVPLVDIKHRSGEGR